MNIFICDDKNNVMDVLSAKLSKLFPNIKTFCFTNPNELLLKIQSLKNTIVIMDIILSNSTGVEISKLINSKNPNVPIILYSGEDKSLFDVYECNHVYFLEKPFSDEKITRAVNKAIKVLQDGFFTYSFNGIKNIVPVNEIYYFESCKRTIHIVTKYETLIFYDKLNNVEEKLPVSFIRVNKSYLINPKYILKIINKKVIIKDADNVDVTQEISISPNYLKRVLEYGLFATNH